jgi:probable DNA repair protein
VNRELSPEIDQWLCGGSLLVTASERAARSLMSAFNRARRSEGLSAWQTPNIRDWKTFALNSWNEHSFDGRIVLNPLQEQSLWAGIVAASAPEAAPVAGARDRLAALAVEAHGLLCSYAPQLLNKKARSAWDQDAGAFSEWLAQFDATCRAGGMISPARLPLELTQALNHDPSERPPLMLAGFDRILPTQQALFGAWGVSTQISPAHPAQQIEFHEAPDPVSELAACAIWCRLELAANPHARLLVVTQDAPNRRGEIERAFLRHLSISSSAAAVFEFSLGVPLGQIALARGAALLLRWFSEPIEEHELDWILSTGQIAASPQESLALTAFVRALRHKNLQRTRWKLAEFLRQRPGAELPTAWVARVTQAQRRLQEFARRPQSPLASAELVPQLLELAGWPGGRPLSSAEFQAHRRWQQIVDDCASLGFDGRSIEWKEFLSALDRTISQTLFAPESLDSPILIAGPAESAGLTADAIWFLGVTEQAWPAGGATHPLLPVAVQRATEMPHSSPRLDWELASTVTRRLLASAATVHFSFARQSEGVESRPSRLIEQLAGAPAPLPPELASPAALPVFTVPFHDSSRVPFPPGEAQGGASTLTAQSQCAFKAFATARLGAETWDPAETGLTAKERGQLLHEVLHSVWAGPPRGIRSHAELVALTDIRAWVADQVRLVIQTAMPVRAHQSMAPRYLALEQSRLINLVTEWLEFERTRVPFVVLDTEQKTGISVAGLPLRLRLDRIDRLIDDSLLVIDYKSGSPTPSSWELPRPDDVQLPIYSNFALDRGPNEVGGLVFAKVRAGEMEFTGKIRNAKATLRGKISGNSNLVKKPLTSEQLSEWKLYIENLALAFLAGHSDVDPRLYPDTCELCRLQALCRISDNPPVSENDEAVDA